MKKCGISGMVVAKAATGAGYNHTGFKKQSGMIRYIRYILAVFKPK